MEIRNTSDILHGFALYKPTGFFCKSAKCSFIWFIIHAYKHLRCGEVQFIADKQSCNRTRFVFVVDCFELRGKRMYEVTNCHLSDNLNITRFVNLYYVGIPVFAKFILTKRNNIVNFRFDFVCNVAEPEWRVASRKVCRC